MARIPPASSSSANRDSYPKRHSLSPSPLTPRSSAAVRRSSSGVGGLRGRKSTSSSISSVRSIPPVHHAHHHSHSHSKASSTSSTGSVSTSVSKTPLHTRSPHHSVKVLPATPGHVQGGLLPSNIRLVREKGGPPLGIPLPIYTGETPGTPVRAGGGEIGGGGMQPPGSPNPFTGVGGVMFAKRKRNIFKGPMLSFASVGARRGERGDGIVRHERSGSIGRGVRQGAAGGEGAIQEVDEDEYDLADSAPGNPYSMGMSGTFGPGYRGSFHARGSQIMEEDEPLDGNGLGVGVGVGEEEEEIEEVDSFAPIVKGPGEIVEELIYEEGEEVPAVVRRVGDGDDAGPGPVFSTLAGAGSAAGLDSCSEVTIKGCVSSVLGGSLVQEPEQAQTEEAQPPTGLAESEGKGKGKEKEKPAEVKGLAPSPLITPMSASTPSTQPPSPIQAQLLSPSPARSQPQPQVKDEEKIQIQIQVPPVPAKDKEQGQSQSPKSPKSAGAEGGGSSSS